MHRKNLVKLIEALMGDGKKIIGYGASTKGNLLLQFCGLTRSHIPFIAEVNEEKVRMLYSRDQHSDYFRSGRSLNLLIDSLHVQKSFPRHSIGELAEMMVRAK
jgi:hypothetical protein